MLNDVAKAMKALDGKNLKGPEVDPLEIKRGPHGPVFVFLTPSLWQIC